MTRAAFSRVVMAAACLCAAISVPARDVVTISGTVSGPDGGVADAEVWAWIPFGDMAFTTTDQHGDYQLSVSGGMVHMRVRAPLEARLGERWFLAGEVSQNLTLDVDLEPGHLLSGAVETPSGVLPQEHMTVELRPLPAGFPHGDWLTADVDPSSGGFQVVAPADVYWLSVNPVNGWYGVPSPADLSSGDQTGVILTIRRSMVNPNPTHPPVAALITVGDVDDLGMAPVEGAPGSVLPLSHVLLVNLRTGHQADAIADQEGRFSSRIFAAPGSVLMVKHGPASERWIDVPSGAAQSLNQFPSTILTLPHLHDGDGGLAFACVGPIDLVIDDVGETRNSVGAAWAMEGRIIPGPGPYEPGDGFRVEGVLRIYGPAIDSGIDLDAVEAIGYGGLTEVFDREGVPISPGGSFMSSLLTPTGFPIQGMGRAAVEGDLEPLSFGSFGMHGDHSIEATFEAFSELAHDTPAGTLIPSYVMVITGVPTSTEWLAARVFHPFFEPLEATLPPIVVDDGSLVWDGDQPRRHLTSRVLMENPVLGIRGTGAVEDAAVHQVTNQVVTQGATYIAPPFNRRTGEPKVYRIEPYLPLIGYTDRRMPAAPLLSLNLPGGMLAATVEGPEGEILEIHPAPLSQAWIHTSSTAAGHDLNPGTTQLNDPYSLTTGANQFWITFQEYGLHRVTMNGEMEDVWGHRYSTGGTFEIWSAHPLDLEPGMLPGTPLAVGDAVAPAVHVTPPVPAEVVWTVTLLPNSNPDAAVTRSVTGRANVFGTFSTTEPALVVDQPGEYRVDLEARYTDDGGALYMGAMTWGGVVMTPDGEADLVAHGRRGLDSLEEIPPSWFVASRDLEIPEGAVSHAFNPYHSGDILWSRMSDGPWGGDALLVVGTVQDTVGDISGRIQASLPDHWPPIMAERIAAGELPLFVATTTGRSPLAYPEEIEILAYSYRSSQRPGVRVREVVSQDTENGGYWRLDTQYDGQPGVGLLGDQPNDFKFQYVGAVYRDLTTGHNEYLGQGTGWVFIPEDDSVGTRVMPPFAGPGNGGWTTLGGPILTMNGQEVHLLVAATGAAPGTVYEVGDTLHLAGHLMPTLPSQYVATITSPGGTVMSLEGEANPVGYLYRPENDRVLHEPGAWTVGLTVWHDGQCSGGSTVPPYPTGGVLGSDDGRFSVYVVPGDAPPLEITSPPPGFLHFGEGVSEIPIRGVLPQGFDDATIHYTISMPGVILEEGQIAASGQSFEIVFDPIRLHERHSNLDLIGRDDATAGLSDTVWIAMLAEGTRGGQREFRPAVVTLQGDEVSVGTRRPRLPSPPRRPSGRMP